MQTTAICFSSDYWEKYETRTIV